jgi:hypothetical protein
MANSKQDCRTEHSPHTAFAEAIIGRTSCPPSGSGKNRLVSSDEQAASPRHLSTSHLTGLVAVVSTVTLETLATWGTDVGADASVRASSEVGTGDRPSAGIAVEGGRQHCCRYLVPNLLTGGCIPEGVGITTTVSSIETSTWSPEVHESHMKPTLNAVQVPPGKHSRFGNAPKVMNSHHGKR